MATTSKVDMDCYNSVCNARFNSQQEQLDRIESITIDNAKILNNGLKDRLAKIEEALRAESPWLKVLYKVFIPLFRGAAFIGGLAVLLRLLPMDVVVRLLEMLLSGGKV